jgi:lipopolysaccharide export system permease protein
MADRAPAPLAPEALRAGRGARVILSSSTLARYVSRNFLLNFLVLMAMLLGVIYIFETIELLRRSANHEQATAGIMFAMSALKLPKVGQQVIPFGILFGAIYTCWKLNRTHELVVIRSAGLSAWQFLAPMVLSALAFGVVATTVINPLSAIFISKYDQMEIVYLQKNNDLVTVSRTGIWLRQPQDSGYALMHADNFDKMDWRFNNMTVFFFDKEDNFQRRIDSPVAYLRNGQWELKSAVVNDRQEVTRVDSHPMATDMTPEKIEESFADPEMLSFWKIPEYINIMEQTGLPATRLQIHFQALLAQPFFLAAMVLLAATFSLRPPRFGGTAIMIVLGVAIGFFIFFMESVLHAFGVSQKIPAYLAAWTPCVVSLLLGMTALLHMEDG